MSSRAALALILLVATPLASSAESGAPEQRFELGFFRWGYTAELGGAIPVGERSYSMANAREFISTFDLGLDVSVDVSRFFQTSFIVRCGFGGIDRDLYQRPVATALGFSPRTIRAMIIQTGVRVRVFPFEARHLRPYLSVGFFFTTMGVTARHDVASADEPGETERATVLEYHYRAASIVPGAGLRYDVGLRARPGLPRYSRVLSLYLQATYSFNFWRYARLDVDGTQGSRESLDAMNLGHVRVTGGVGVMF